MICHNVALIAWPVDVGCQLGRCSAWPVKLFFARAFVCLVSVRTAHKSGNTTLHVCIQCRACIYLGGNNNKNKTIYFGNAWGSASQCSWWRTKWDYMFWFLFRFLRLAFKGTSHKLSNRYDDFKCEVAQSCITSAITRNRIDKKHVDPLGIFHKLICFYSIPAQQNALIIFVWTCCGAVGMCSAADNFWVAKRFNNEKYCNYRWY